MLARPIPAERLLANGAAVYKSKWESYARANAKKLTEEELEANIIKWSNFCTGSGGRYDKKDFDAAAEEARVRVGSWCGAHHYEARGGGTQSVLGCACVCACVCVCACLCVSVRVRRVRMRMLG